MPIGPRKKDEFASVEPRDAPSPAQRRYDRWKHENKEAIEKKNEEVLRGREKKKKKKKEEEETPAPTHPRPPWKPGRNRLA
jgi:hypothetical protein